ncbi:MAG: hypothetical protein U1E76_26835 [Planctomycetota bacterium]
MTVASEDLGRASWHNGRMRGFPLAFWFASCSLISAAGSSAQELGKLYQDQRRGFAIRPPARWTAIPVSPTEATVVAQWHGKRSDDSRHPGVKFMPELNVLVFGPAAAAGSQYEDYLKRALHATIVKQEDLPFGGLRARAYQANVALGSDAAARLHATAFAVGGQEIVVQFACLEERYDTYRIDFVASTRSFQTIDVAAGASTDPEPEHARFLDEQKTRARAAGWEVLESPSGRYLFIFNAEKEFVRELLWRIEAIRDHYERLYPPEQPITAVSIVRVCKNLTDYQAYGGPPGTGGYWLAPAQELVFFDNKDRDRDTGYAVLMHEGFHQYIYYYYGELAPHSWYNEGHGDYFGGAELVRKGNTGRVVRVRPLTAAGIDRLATVKTALQQGTTIPLKDFFHLSQQQYYATDRRQLCYAQGWSIVYFLREGSKSTVMEQEWLDILPSYLGNLVAAFRAAKAAAPDATGIDQDAVREQAYQATFGAYTRDDWQRLERAWKTFQG